MADGFLGLPTIKFNDTELIKESKLVIFHYYFYYWILKNLKILIYREAYFNRKQQERKQAKQEQRAV